MEEKGPRKPGVCFPWEEKQKEFSPLSGNQELVKQIWEEIDLLGYIFIWHCLVSF